MTAKRVFALTVLSIIWCSGLAVAAGRGLVVGAEYEPGDFRLCAGGEAAAILVGEDDARVVAIAAEALAGDIERVCGARPAVVTDPADAGTHAVVIGTIDSGAHIRALAESGAIDTSGIEGKWETFRITVVENPMGGVESALVAAGSDRRGAAFAAFEISRGIGVSPWAWWADVTPEKQETLIVKAGAHVFGPPSVKYRGIFLNDEDYGLQPWAAKTFEPESGDIGPKTYAEIFELMLRLRSNFMWPAMHKCTRAFNTFDRNKFVADEYAIVMGSSHCEQMLRNNVGEWETEERGFWSYTKNRKKLLDYWDERVGINGGFENVYTLGMRGIHDSGMPDGETVEEKVELLESIIADQRRMLARHVNEDVTQVPQIFVPYKEVLEIYWGGLDVPEDVTIVWADDNFGYMRRLGTPEERSRPGGNGVYYHISYWGPPHDYLWLYTIPPALIWEEMRKAFDYNARELWVLNVGDIKPHEIGTEFFLDLAWDIDSWNEQTVDGFLEAWAAREFGPGFASETADILRRYFILNYHRKPEHMGFYDKYTIYRKIEDPEFSLIHYGDEVRRRIDAFDDIEKRAGALFAKMPPEKKDAFYQLVVYPVRGASLINKKFLNAYKSREYARQGRMSADKYAKRAIMAYKGIIEETKYYNNELAGGKWKHMMDDSPNDLPAFGKVPIGRSKPDPKPRLGVVVEGSAGVIPPESSAGASRKHQTLPAFNRFTRQKYYIDIFNTGAAPIEWTAATTEDWILLSDTYGTLEGEKRLTVDIDYDAAPGGEDTGGEIIFTGGGAEYKVSVEVFNDKSAVGVAPGAFVQDNGVIAMNAEDFADAEIKNGFGWKVIPGLGRTGAAIGIIPFTMDLVETGDLHAAAPAVAYPVHVFQPGEAEIIIHAVPTHELHSGRLLRVYVSVDGGKPVPLDFIQAHEEVDDIGQLNVQRNMMEGGVTMEIGPGAHTLKIWGVDPSVVLDRIIVDFGGLRNSYLGPSPTRAR